MLSSYNTTFPVVRWSGLFTHDLLSTDQESCSRCEFTLHDWLVTRGSHTAWSFTRRNPYRILCPVSNLHLIKTTREVSQNDPPVLLCPLVSSCYRLTHHAVGETSESFYFLCPNRSLMQFMYYCSSWAQTCIAKCQGSTHDSVPSTPSPWPVLWWAVVEKIHKASKPLSEANI